MKIYEDIGITLEIANKCWDRDCINDLEEFNPGVVLKEIISDENLSIEEKVYITWIYAYTLNARKEFKISRDNAF